MTLVLVVVVASNGYPGEKYSTKITYTSQYQKILEWCSKLDWGLISQYSRPLALSSCVDTWFKYNWTERP